jgi:hypothetical protein
MERIIDFKEQEDFSVIAMRHAVKGPTIQVKNVSDKKLYPLALAYEQFME